MGLSDCRKKVGLVFSNGYGYPFIEHFHAWIPQSDHLLHTLEITTQYPPGACWVNQKGWTVSIYNKGDVPAVQWIWQIVSEE